MEIMTTPVSSSASNGRLFAAPELHRHHSTAATAASSSAIVMAAAAANGARSPFQREVREWQRIDPDTGAMLTGRLEADRWMSGPLNSYGKISDSQNISQPNGTQQTQRKQLEVIQTCTAGGGAMQVIRAQTVQTTSSRWSSSASASSSATASPSPPSLMQLSGGSQRVAKDKANKQAHKRTSNSSTNTISTKNNTHTNSLDTAMGSTGTAFSRPSAHNRLHGKYHSNTSHTNGQISNSPRSVRRETSKTTTTKTTTTANSVNGLNNVRRNWPQIVTENAALEICDNDHDNDHVHDNDYIVEAASDEDEDADDNHSHDNDSLAEEEQGPADVQHLKRLNKSSQRLLKSRQTFAPISKNGWSEDDGDEEAHHPHQQRHRRFHAPLDNNGHSSSNSSLNSHSGNSCSGNTSNQLFLLDTAPSLKLSNLMKSSSSISNSSNNSTTATATPMNNTMNTATTTKATTTAATSAAASASMSNTHNKSQTGKISLHAIVGNETSGSELAAKTTASSTPSTSPATAATGMAATTTATTRSSWQQQQPTIFRQNSQHHNNLSPNQKSKHSHGGSVDHRESLSQHQLHGASSSHLMKTRVGDNNCCSCSSDESRSYTANANGGEQQRHHHHHHHHHQSQQQQQQAHRQPLQQPPQRQSPPVFQLKLQQNDRLTPTQSTQLRQQQHHNRVDMESFRHYNNNDSNSNGSTNNNFAGGVGGGDISNNNNTGNSRRSSNTFSSHDTYVADTAAHHDNDDDGLRLSLRHIRRQQIPISTNQSTNALQRSRSISTDDLSTEWDINGGDSEEPAEWRRVSKLRRSFQSTSRPTSSPAATRRPLDLPTNSVSVSKIRAELENGRRLNTVMKNNHVDLAALSSILNGPENKTPPSSKRSSFLTAESLKEIRGRLKKLSDESLYREDFVINQQTAAQLPEREHIEVQPTTIRRSLERSPERYKARDLVEKRAENNRESANHTTNSLESRLKYKEANSTEWHLRRKSYGFEKMSPPDKTSMMRMDASTDSGLGRSGELQNWSPTSEAATAASSRNSTVIHFGEQGNAKRPTPSATRRYRPQQSYEESENSPDDDMAVSKRHSIAVDESQYVRDSGRQTTQVHLNGFYQTNGGDGKLIQTAEMASTTTSFGPRGQQKRVEFCKTEVHFATESGRVNIVETDSKPPPTNNFRRRRSRSSSVGPLQSLVKSATTVSTTSSSSLAATTASTVAMPVTLFGDDNARPKTIASTTVAYRAPLVGSPEPKEPLSNVTVTLADTFGQSESSRSSYASTSGVESTDYETDEMTSLRGILKNKPAKPKPYVLGENIEKPDELWGVQLKPVLGKVNGLGRDTSPSPPLTILPPQRSVAERVRLVEQQQTIPSTLNGFSTKINVSLGDEALPSSKGWEETDLPKSNVMSIKLHSPQATVAESITPLKLNPPMAKPRTLIQDPQPISRPTAVPTKAAPFQSSLATKDSLKIQKDVRGARQLRDHELSYFGIQMTKFEHDDKVKTKFPTTTSTISSSRNSPKRSLPLRRLSEETSINADAESTSTKWQLDHDKPDLLKHSSIVSNDRKPAVRRSLYKSHKSDAEDDAEEHLYENIANEITPVFKVKASSPPHSYDRKMDLHRDAMILSEMNKNADQTLRELSDEAALKDRKRRSLQRRNSKPLETIDEKAITERVSDTCIKVSRGTFASEAKKTSRHSTPSPSRGVQPHRERSSSQSSVECCPRARSRSLSSEKEYESAKTSAAKTSTRSTQLQKHRTASKHQSGQNRSSSLDSHRSHHSQYSSGDEQHQSQQQQQQGRHSFRREDRSRTKTKRVATPSSSSHKSTDRIKSREEKPTKSSYTESKRSSSTTRSSNHKERAECCKDETSGPVKTSSASTPPASSRHHHHHATAASTSTSSFQRATTTGGSGRRHPDESRDSQRIKRSTATASGRHESKDGRSKSATRAATTTIHEERNSAARLSSHRLERSDKDKDKASRPKAPSSRSTVQQTTPDRGHERHRMTATKEGKSKSSSSTSAAAAALISAGAADNPTHSKNEANHHHQQRHRSENASKERSKERSTHERHSSHQPHQPSQSQRATESSASSKRREEESPRHVHGLKSAIIKTTAKLRDKSRARKEKK